MLAKHLLWLYDHRDEYGPPDSRFLVEGKKDSEVIQSLRTSSRFAQAVVRAILGAIEPNTTPTVKSGVSLEGNRLCVTISAIEAQHKMQKSSNQALAVHINTAQVAKALRNLLTTGTEPSFRARKTTLDGKTQNLRWYDIDVKLLYDFADRAGYSVTVLEDLFNKQKTDPEGTKA